MENKSRTTALKEMLINEPNDEFLNYALAMEMLAVNDFLAAEMQLQKVLLINVSYLPCYYQLGQLYEKLNNYALAIDFYKKGIELAKTKNNTKALAELNEALWMLED